MDRFLTVAQVIAPIFAAVFLGALARKKQLMKPEEVQALQNFVVKFALPCVLFNSCFTADVSGDSVGVMVLVLPCVLLSSLWSFRFGKKRFPYHNLPMIFGSQETGMLGIPLFMVLFGAEQAYRMGILDIAQAFVALPTIALLASTTDAKLSPVQILRNLFTSPLLLCSLLGLALNLTGLARILNDYGVGGVITASTGFLSQPVSAVMIFSVGYNFSISRDNRKPVLGITLAHFLIYALICIVVQLGLMLIPNVEPATRWAVLMYCTLPASYLAPGLGKTSEDTAVASGVCSLLTVVSLLFFCVIAVLAA